ncbi:hypothetical protein BKA64DRAFT_187773 [Cadophora sp. MPI-SDFR-AT-0126]|nr:hypothetical protein BKA64DRAFT_187773 [Leotiomycetes sp. MPI-SDFR-AT-0126]
MKSHDTALPSHARLFGEYQIGGNSRGQTFELVPESPFTAPLVFANHGLPSFSQAPAASPLINELAAFSLKPPKCPQCKGKSFDFTAYFHNPRIFASPPHELLDLVERSYILKNRLHSILVTYILHDLRDDHMMQDVRSDIHDWVRQVTNLAAEARKDLGKADGVEDGLAGVKAWTEGTANQLGEHLELFKGQKMEVPKGWKKEVLSEFRKQWEKVWIACANACAYHQGIISQQGENYQNQLGR